MKTVLNLTDEVYDRLLEHLFPPASSDEQAAFLFSNTKRTKHAVSFHVVDVAHLTTSDFDEQARDYLELSDAARASMIKRAHDLGASLIEVHCHPAPFEAAFSPADVSGLQDTVPHMWWRLKKRPYVALVFAPTGFDALVWLDDPRVPGALNYLITGDRLLSPTNNTLRIWS